MCASAYTAQSVECYWFTVKFNTKSLWNSIRPAFHLFILLLSEFPFRNGTLCEVARVCVSILKRTQAILDDGIHMICVDSHNWMLSKFVCFILNGSICSWGKLLVAVELRSLSRGPHNKRHIMVICIDNPNVHRLFFSTITKINKKREMPRILALNFPFSSQKKQRPILWLLQKLSLSFCQTGKSTNKVYYIYRLEC